MKITNEKQSMKILIESYMKISIIFILKFINCFLAWQNMDRLDLVIL